MAGIAVGDRNPRPVPNPVKPPVNRYVKRGNGTTGGTTGGTFDPVDRNALDRMKALLDSFGLGSLAAKVMTYLQEGMGQDSIMLELQNTTEWKARFAANDRRRAAGKSVLTPEEYLKTERAYAQIMAEAGVPSGFYDQPTDFTDFLSKDISPAELQGRVKSATDFVRAADPSAKAYMKQWYTEGDLIAYALDPKRAAPMVGKAFQAASIGGIAGNDGLGLSQGVAEKLAEAGVNDATAREGFGQLGQDKRTIDLLAGLNGQQAYSGDQLAEAAFLGDAGLQQGVSKLKSAERGRFAGSSGVGKGSLSKSTGL